MDNKNKPFLTNTHSPDKQLFGIPVVQSSSSSSPRKIPGYEKDYFLELIDSEGKIKALFFMFGEPDESSLLEWPNWKSFIYEFDNWINPEYRQWENIEFRFWFPKIFDESEIQRLLEDAGVADINDLDYGSIDQYWLDRSKPEGIDIPFNSRLPALFLMAYGRLKYPYRLSDENRNYYEIYVRGYIKEGYLPSTLKRLAGTPNEIGEWINVCSNVFPDVKSFRDACVYSGRYKEFIDWDLDTFGMIADSILCAENIDRFLDEAHAQNKPELKLFLLDYKNKHFPAEGDLLQLNPDKLNS